MRALLYQQMVRDHQSGSKKIAILIDPDKVTPESLIATLDTSVKAGVDYFFIGGSLLIQDTMPECIDVIKSCCEIPVIIFPGSPLQIHSGADALLLLSLISGRNPELLIGNHVQSAVSLRDSQLEIISTGYLLIDGGQPTTVSYISNTLPIPHDKDEVALCTAMAGEMIGMKLIYLEGGSGSGRTVSESMVQKVKENITVPLLVGGGISSPEKAVAICRAGADIVVVGTAAEKNPLLIQSIAHAIHTSVVV
jgi:putative glycerol-1-phosphate prenyltransferase